METKLQAVRAKVIEAVPEIETCRFCDAVPYNFDDSCVEGMHDEVVTRPITLADVLRAIGTTHNKHQMIDAMGKFYHYNPLLMEHLYDGNWNLALPLDENIKENPELGEFLYKILCWDNYSL